MAIVKQFDARSGITYVYESISHYERETGKKKNTRHLIGRWDETTQSIIPTDGRCRKDRVKKEVVKEPKPVAVISNEDYKLLYENEVKKNLKLVREIEELKKKYE